MLPKMKRSIKYCISERLEDYIYEMKAGGGGGEGEGGGGGEGGGEISELLPRLPLAGS